jgi:hypothetical protein
MPRRRTLTGRRDRDNNRRLISANRRRSREEILNNARNIELDTLSDTWSDTWRTASLWWPLPKSECRTAWHNWSRYAWSDISWHWVKCVLFDCSCWVWEDVCTNFYHPSITCNESYLHCDSFQWHNNVIDCEVLTGTSIGLRVLIPRINLTFSGTILPFKFQRTQFPVITAFAMTINKSQGQTFDKVGIFLRQPVFTHGQLYVAASRVKTFQDLKFFICEHSQQGHLDFFKGWQPFYPILCPSTWASGLCVERIKQSKGWAGTVQGK